VCLKQSGISSSTVFLEGQIGSDPNIKYKKLTQVTQILLTVDCDTWKRVARSCSGSPCLNLQRKRKNWSIVDNLEAPKP